MPNPSSWNLSGNWLPTTVPTSSTDVIVGAPAPAIIDSANANALTLDVTVAGAIEIQGGRTLTVFGTKLTNNGTITVNSNNSTTLTTLNFGNGGLTLDGSGQIILAGIPEDARVSNSINATIQAADHTIRGEGQVAANLINFGTITASEATGDSAAEMVLTSGAKINHGLIQSSPTATLRMDVDISQSATGVLRADTSTMFLNNITVAGGTLESAGGGVFRTAGNALEFDGVVALNGQLNLVSGSGLSGNLIVRGGGFANNGTILVNQDNTGNSFLHFADTGTIGGTGEILLNSPVLNARVQTSTGAVGTFGSGQTMRGVGRIEGEIVNDGLIIAEVRSGGTEIEFVNSPPKTNNNLIRADVGATIGVRGTSITQNSANGIILADGGVINLRGNSIVRGGRINAAAGGKVTVFSDARVEDVTLNAPVEIPTGANTLTFGGSVVVNNNEVTVAANLALDGNVVVGGTGEIVLDSPSTAVLNVLTGSTATLGAGQVLRRTMAGTSNSARVNGPGTFVNNGRVEGASPSLIISLNGPVGGSGALKHVRINDEHDPGAPGATAQVAIEGVYELTNFGAALNMQIGGTIPGAGYDQLFSSDPTSVITIGSANTQLNVTLINGFLPANGDIFTLISTAGTLTANFSSVSLPSLPAGWVWDNVSTPQTLAYRAIEPLAADFDEDGDVDNDDFVRWTSGFGVGTMHGQGDADDDSDVDGADFLIWQRQLGLTAGPASPTAVPTPEPASSTLFVAAAAGCMMLRRKALLLFGRYPLPRDVVAR